MIGGKLNCRQRQQIRMGTKQIHVSGSFRAYLKSKQQEGETAERLRNDFSLYEWATEDWENVDDEDRTEVAGTLRGIDDEDDFAEPGDELPS